jgi:hypothetical protein
MMSLQKKLYIANGRWKDRQHIYVCGYNKTDVINILSELSGSRGMQNEFNKSFNKGCWGRTMDGIDIERGAWVTDSNDGSPKRIYPIGAEAVIKKDHYQANPAICSSCVHYGFPNDPCRECIHHVG